MPAEAPFLAKMYLPPPARVLTTQFDPNHEGYPQATDLQRMELLHLLTRAHVGEPEDCRLVTNGSQIAAIAYLRWLSNDIHHQNQDSQWVTTPQCMDYIDGALHTLYLLGASEQPPAKISWADVQNRLTLSRHLVYCRDLCASVVLPGAFPFVDKVLTDMSGVSDPFRKAVVLPNTGLLTEMDPSLGPELKAILNHHSYKGVWKTFAQALRKLPDSWHDQVIAQLQLVQSDNLEVQDFNRPTQYSLDFAHARNFDLLLQAQAFLELDPSNRKDFPAFFAENELLFDQLLHTIHLVRDIYRNKVYLGPKHWNVLTDHLQSTHTPVSLAYIETSSTGQTSASFQDKGFDMNQTYEPISNWTYIKPGNFAALFYWGYTRTGVPMEIQFIPAAALFGSWQAHGDYKRA